MIDNPDKENKHEWLQTVRARWEKIHVARFRTSIARYKIHSFPYYILLLCYVFQPQTRIAI